MLQLFSHPSPPRPRRIATYAHRDANDKDHVSVDTNYTLVWKKDLPPAPQGENRPLAEFYLVVSRVKRALPKPAASMPVQVPMKILHIVHPNLPLDEMEARDHGWGLCLGFINVVCGLHEGFTKYPPLDGTCDCRVKCIMLRTDIPGLLIEFKSEDSAKKADRLLEQTLLMGLPYTIKRLSEYPPKGENKASTVATTALTTATAPTNKGAPTMTTTTRTTSTPRLPPHPTTSTATATTTFTPTNAIPAAGNPPPISKESSRGSNSVIPSSSLAPQKNPSAAPPTAPPPARVTPAQNKPLRVLLLHVSADERTKHANMFKRLRDEHIVEFVEEDFSEIGHALVGETLLGLEAYKVNDLDLQQVMELKQRRGGRAIEFYGFSYFERCAAQGKRVKPENGDLVWLRGCGQLFFLDVDAFIQWNEARPITALKQMMSKPGAKKWQCFATQLNYGTLLDSLRKDREVLQLELDKPGGCFVALSAEDVKAALAATNAATDARPEPVKLGSWLAYRNPLCRFTILVSGGTAPFQTTAMSSGLLNKKLDELASFLGTI